MFFSGNEVQNDHYLYQYNIHNDYKIQVMKTKKKLKIRILVNIDIYIKILSIKIHNYIINIILNGTSKINVI